MSKMGRYVLEKQTEKIELEHEIVNLNKELTQEQILWRKYGKGIQFDNIVILKDKIKTLTTKLNKL